jgi:hypothetical protein
LEYIFYHKYCFFLYLHETNHKTPKKKSIKSRKLKKQNTRKKQAEKKNQLLKNPKEFLFILILKI